MSTHPFQLLFPNMQVNFEEALSISGYGDNSLLRIKEEMNSSDYVQSFPCDNSGIDFKAMYPEQHVKMVTGFKCEMCDKVFPTIFKLNRHNESHSTEKTFSCTKCDKVFPTITRLNRHKKRHSTEKPFRCNKCLKTFRASQELRGHNQKHTKEKPFTCS